MTQIKRAIEFVQRCWRLVDIPKGIDTSAETANSINTESSVEIVESIFKELSAYLCK
jgi:hypothetical protein